MLNKKTISLLGSCLLLATGVNAADPTPPAVKPAVENVQTPVPAEPAPAPLEKQTPPELPSSHEMTQSYENAFVKMLVTLLGLIVLILGTFWVLRRLGKGRFTMGSSKSITILERRPLSPKSMLYLVECDNKRILISESQLEVRALASTDETLPEESF